MMELPRENFEIWKYKYKVWTRKVHRLLEVEKLLANTVSNLEYEY